MGPTRYSLRWLLLLFLATGLIACQPIGRSEVRRGLNSALVQLPEPADFAIVVITASQHGPDWGATCYGASATVAIGTELQDEVALGTYISALEAQGWSLKPRKFFSVESNRLQRGKHESLILSTGGPGFLLDSDERYQAERTQYPHFVYASLSYHLPGRIECLGE